MAWAPPYAPDLGDPSFLGRGQHRGLESAGRRHHGDPLHACHGGGNGVHQHGGGIGRSAAGNIDPNGLQRRPTPAQFHTGLVLEPLVSGALALMIGADALGGEGDRFSDFGRALHGAVLDLLGADPDVLGADIGPIELTAEAQNRLQALGAHGQENVTNQDVNVFGGLATLINEGGEGGLEAGL